MNIDALIENLLYHKEQGATEVAIEVLNDVEQGFHTISSTMGLESVNVWKWDGTEYELKNVALIELV